MIPLLPGSLVCLGILDLSRAIPIAGHWRPGSPGFTVWIAIWIEPKTLSIIGKNDKKNDMENLFVVAGKDEKEKKIEQHTFLKKIEV